MLPPSKGGLVPWVGRGLAVKAQTSGPNVEEVEYGMKNQGLII